MLDIERSTTTNTTARAQQVEFRLDAFRRQHCRGSQGRFKDRQLGSA
jgi:hypothetical protein